MYDFRKHKLFVEKKDNLLIHNLQLPNSKCFQVQFINLLDKLIVIGDFGEFIFNVGFTPKPTETCIISKEYWAEKLSNHINVMEWDQKETEKKLIAKLEEEEISPREMAYYKKCLYYVWAGEWEYKVAAMDCKCNTDIIFCEKYNNQFEIIIQAFKEVCKRLNKKKKEVSK